MHSLNHIFRATDLVMKNDAKVARHQESAKEEILHTDGYLDRGFTRPKVLILLPLASIALRVVKRLIQLTPAKHKVNVEHNDRFYNEFATGGVEDKEELEYIDNSTSQKSSKPSDFQALFGENNNDHFMIGIKFTRRSIKLYSDFYSSDMIVASPLGLITDNAKNIPQEPTCAQLGKTRTEIGNEKITLHINLEKKPTTLIDLVCSITNKCKDASIGQGFYTGGGDDLFIGFSQKIGEAEVEKEKDVDYLSSIEVLIIDHADVIAMQNWSHVSTIIEQLNRIPSKQHGTDIMRIRQWYIFSVLFLWYLDGQAQFYRQTIILGSHVNPGDELENINALFNHHCVNYQGKVHQLSSLHFTYYVDLPKFCEALLILNLKLDNFQSSLKVKLVCAYKGVLPKVLLPVRQVYERFDAESIVDADNARFEYFTKKVFPKIKDSIQGGIMLFISSYFEFVRVRNFLKSQDASFCLLGEYTKQSDISRGRVWFFQGRRKIMLYTERAHFYHRYKIRGIQNLIIYSLPERKEFYPEIVNMLEGSHSMICTVLFSRFDQFRLERVVGTAPAKRMVSSEKGVFVFC
ncbi:unnamed protein product [Ilex paraguariensis]|uniref:Digestive organ expansion factor-like protein n=1 Tax=Ilex paraguariensis TaxID=185542 RepID=A0ABC8TMG2_9AQUA